MCTCTSQYNRNILDLFPVSGPKNGLESCINLPGATCADAWSISVGSESSYAKTVCDIAALEDDAENS
jgi:hypothetical protein